MITWTDGSKYPSVDTLIGAYKKRKSDNNRNMIMYCLAIIVFCGAIFAACRENLMLIAGVVAIIICVVWLSSRNVKYKKAITKIESGDFEWCAGTLQNKWKRMFLDINAGSTYQVGLHDEWIECDMATYNTAEIGKTIVIIKETEKSCFGIMTPEGKGYKQVKRIARQAG